MVINHAYILLTVVVGIIYPVYAMLTGNSTRQMLLQSPHKKIYAYKYTAALQLILSCLIFISLILNNDDLEVLGLSFLHQPMWILILIVACLIALWVLNKIEVPESKIEKLTSQYKDVIFIVPSTLREYKWSIVLSVVVGTLEEIIFRGFLFWQLHQYMPLIPAIIITNLVFALAHYATKLKNIFTAFILGIIFSTTYSLVGSLWLSIFSHILVDMYSATLAKKLFINRDIKVNRENKKCIDLIGAIMQKNWKRSSKP